MDFELGEEEQAIRDLTAQVLDDMSSHERLRALAAEGDHVDRKAWAALAATGVVGASIPETHGGLGLGFLATAVALEEVGRRASPVPLLTTAVMVAMPVAAFGTTGQREILASRYGRWLGIGLRGTGRGRDRSRRTDDGGPFGQRRVRSRRHQGAGRGRPGRRRCAGARPSRRRRRWACSSCRPAPKAWSASPVGVTTGRPEARFELVGCAGGCRVSARRGRGPTAPRS